MKSKHRRIATVGAAACPACIERGEPTATAGKVARLKSDGTYKPDYLGTDTALFAVLRCPRCDAVSKWRIPDLRAALEAGGVVRYEDHTSKMLTDWRLQMGLTAVEGGLNIAQLGRALGRAVVAGVVDLDASPDLQGRI